MVFSHDGLRDSLTHLAAPPYFYENLRRELVAAERNRNKLSLIRIVINFDRKDLPDSQYELAILSLAELIKSMIRIEDLCARLGRFEFTLLIKSEVAIAEKLALRVLGQWEVENFSPSFSTVAIRYGESSLEILNRLDNQELQEVTTI